MRNVCYFTVCCDVITPWCNVVTVTFQSSHYQGVESGPLGWHGGPQHVFSSLHL